MLFCRGNCRPLAPSARAIFYTPVARVLREEVRGVRIAPRLSVVRGHSEMCLWCSSAAWVLAVFTAISQLIESDRLSCQFVESVCRTCQSEFRKLPENIRWNPFKHKAMRMHWFESGSCYLAQLAG